ncbi:sensor domain-containing diguanylate cyclase [Desulfovibrio sp. SGI.169]|uniref:sensor domain-containing diguanylate cyclase n=1 Tax=Desulfovibrio sp. SGI.169 TaxID=3420561 RepID=UPI003D052721
MSTQPVACLIPLTSSEPLWEWDIASDTLFLSLGACSLLKLPSAPASMAHFLEHIPPRALPRLSKLREGVLSGLAGSSLQCDYLFNNTQIQEHMLVLSRHENGRATRAIGRYDVVPSRPAVKAEAFFGERQDVLPDVGIWLYSITNKCVWRDSACAALLGAPASKSCFIAHDASLPNVHPEDKEALHQGYRLLIERKSQGDSRDDIVRILSGGGQYEHMLLRGSVLERDSHGQATLLAGTLQHAKSAALHNLYFSEGRLSYVLEAVGDGLWEWNLQNNRMHCNPRYLTMLGYTREEFPFTVNSWKEKIHPDDCEKIVNSHLAMIASPSHGDSIECTYRMRRADGSWVWIFRRGCVTSRDADGRARYMVGFITNITSVQNERDKLEDMVKNDALTSLRSRSYCNLEIERIEREGIRPVCVIYSDITGLKMINDNLGHSAGDAVLSEAATLLRKNLRASDCVARMGGDEFVVLLPHCAPGDGLKKLKAIEDCFIERNRHTRRLPILASFGLAHSESLDTPLAKALVQADTCMLRKKKAQRESAQQQLKSWIEAHTGKSVSDDDRLPSR